MATKYIPTDAELKAMLECYKQYGTYAAVARQFNLSSSVATRIIKENKDVQFASPVIEYLGPQPTEHPDYNTLIRFYNPTNEWRDSYIAEI